MQATIPLAWGADLAAVVIWPDGAGGAANLTGCTVEILRPSPALAGRLTATLTDPPNGRIALALTWDDEMGAAQLPLRFSIRITPPDGPRQASSLIGIQVR